MTFFRMENGNYEQKYQESNILKNTDRYMKIDFYIKTRVSHDPNNTLVLFPALGPKLTWLKLFRPGSFVKG